MFEFEAARWVPRFILDDKNGYAVAKAIEAAMKYLNDTILQGVKCITDYDSMPEWRLDELAWELNCLYDYSADIETKRTWIKNAVPLYRLWGTPHAIYQYVRGYFDNIDLEENWIYGGEPYHFRMTVEGEWTAKNEAWVRRAIQTAKNVRSVLDSLRIGHRCFIGITAEGGVLARFVYPLTGTEAYAGRWPQENMLGALDETGRAGVRAEAVPFAYPYKMVGVTPDINTLGVLEESRQGLVSDATGHPFDYPMTGGDARAGTIPQENMLGALDETGCAGMGAEVVSRSFPYEMTGDDTRAGTVPQANMLAAIEHPVIPSAQAEDTIAKILYKLCGQDEI